MQLLRKLATFNIPEEDMKHIYIWYIRSLLEHLCVVWHSMLTSDNKNDLERLQKSAFKIILKEKYKNYQNALNRLQLVTLEERREQLILSFAKKCITNDKMKSLFPLNKKNHIMNTRCQEKYFVNHAKTSRLQNSPIIYMQKKLNDEAN